MRWLLLLLLALVACSDGPRPIGCIIRGGVARCGFDAGSSEPPEGLCNPLVQTGCNPGEKCTWFIDQVTPTYIGHIGCSPDGSVDVGSACYFGTSSGGDSAPGPDNCKKGSVCSSYGALGSAGGICKMICDNAGGNPMCGAMQSCVDQQLLFWTGATSPAAGGLCETSCNPLDDNDFDGSGSALSRIGSACGSATIGCYGMPSEGSPPATAFACLPEQHYAMPLHHRSECTAPDCVDPTGRREANACNQGYEPVLSESTAVSTQICVALCAPLDCYAGNCGSNNANRIGAAPHRCANPDALGSFGSGEECRYMWHDELDGSGHWLPSPYSDSVGICVDHDAYGMPRCEDLPLRGSGSALGAVDLGCVSTTTAGVMP